jgi:hypothetical protein
MLLTYILCIELTQLFILKLHHNIIFIHYLYIYIVVCYTYRLQMYTHIVIYFEENRIFFKVFLCDNSNVSYRKKRGSLWPVSRRVKSAETLVVFLNLGWVLYFIRKLKKRKILSYIQLVPKVSEDQWGKCVF